MLAAYATMRNEGDAPLTLIGADSADFGAVSMHESVAENGVERMRPLGRLDIAPGARVEFSPGGKHFMLMRPAHELKSGDKVKIHIATDVGDDTTAEFTVRDEAPTVTDRRGESPQVMRRGLPLAGAIQTSTVWPSE